MKPPYTNRNCSSDAFTILYICVNAKSLQADGMLKLPLTFQKSAEYSALSLCFLELQAVSGCQKNTTQSRLSLRLSNTYKYQDYQHYTPFSYTVSCALMRKLYFICFLLILARLFITQYYRKIFSFE